MFVASLPAAVCLQGDCDSVFLISSDQVIVNSNKVFPFLYIFQAEQTHLAQFYMFPLTRLVASTGLTPAHPCLTCTGEARTGHSTPDVSHQGEENDQFPVSAGYTLMQPEMMLACFASRACCWLLFNLSLSRTSGPFCRAPSQPAAPRLPCCIRQSCISQAQLSFRTCPIYSCQSGDHFMCTPRCDSGCIVCMSV